jgi:hypothetical protein
LSNGQWLPWLEENFSMDERTAQRAMAAARFAAKYDNLSDLRLKKSALYELASADCGEDFYQADVVGAVLEEAKFKTVNGDRVWEINRELHPPRPHEETLAEIDGILERGEKARAEREAEAESDAEAEAILDGDGPSLPPPPELITPDPKLAQFERAIKSLLEIHTTSVGKFVSTEHSVDDLTRIYRFIEAVADMIARLDVAA